MSGRKSVHRKRRTKKQQDSRHIEKAHGGTTRSACCIRRTTVREPTRSARKILINTKDAWRKYLMPFRETTIKRAPGGREACIGIIRVMIPLPRPLLRTPRRTVGADRTEITTGNVRESSVAAGPFIAVANRALLPLIVLNRKKERTPNTMELDK